MATTMQENCGRILQTVRTCNLNFSCQETPYSIYLTIRKSWSKRKHQQVHEPVHQAYQHDRQNLLEATNSEVVSLSELAAVKSKLKASESLTSKAAAEVINHHETVKGLLNKKEDEIKLLKTSIKNKVSECEMANAELKNIRKTIKSKEKEVYNLENVKLNQQETISSMKMDSNRIKAEIVKLEKKIKLLEKKKEDFKHQNKTKTVEKNNSNSSIQLSSSACTSASNSKSDTSTVSTATFSKESTAKTIKTIQTPPRTNSTLTPTTPALRSSPLSASTCSRYSDQPQIKSTSSFDTLLSMLSCSPRTPPGTPPCNPPQSFSLSDTPGDISDTKNKNPIKDLKEMIAREKLSFDELLEAVKNTKLNFEDSTKTKEEDTCGEIDYEQYPDSYWEVDQI